MTKPEMTRPEMGAYLHRIPSTNTISGLCDLLEEIIERFPDDEATPSLTAFITRKIERLTPPY